MKKALLTLILFHMAQLHFSQEVISLPHHNTTGTVWKGPEKNFFSEMWQTQVITNVAVPTLEIHLPDPLLNNGTSVIIAPGGGLYALSINSEGNDVAKWLNAKGITAFVLKYRLVPTGENGVQELADDGALMEQKTAKVLPLSISDGLEAIAYVREHAGELQIDPRKIGFMGFSAGGAVTMGVTFNYTEKNRPDFIVPVYPWMTVLGDYQVPADAPPMLIVCATDDPLGLATSSIDLYTAWQKAHKSVGLHMYSKGGHGFGMRTQGLPSDTWIARFHDWAIAEGLVTPDPKK